MNAKEYLSQVKYLEQAITYKMREIEYWKNMAENLSSHGLEEHFNPNRPQEASFTHCFEMIDEITHDIEERTAQLISLRKDIDYRISLLNSIEEQMVLHYRYLEKMNWNQIERIMNRCRSAIFRIHGQALAKLSVPDEK